jgi:hypothetical protein
MTEALAERLEAEEPMFVQTAAGIDSDGQTLTLRRITPSERPNTPPDARRRRNGH